MENYSLVKCRRSENVSLLPEICKLRYKVFSQRLDWKVVTIEDVEIDKYDLYDPTYIVVLDKECNVLACTRMLDTTGPYMLRDTFPMLLGNIQAPSKSQYSEASRFAVDTSLDKAQVGNGLRLATSMLLIGMVEWALERGIEKVVAVVDVRMERILARAGWHLDRYTAPQMIGKTPALGGELPVSNAVLLNMRARAGIHESVWDHAERRVAA